MALRGTKRGGREFGFLLLDRLKGRRELVTGVGVGFSWKTVAHKRKESVV